MYCSYIPECLSECLKLSYKTPLNKLYINDKFLKVECFDLNGICVSCYTPVYAIASVSERPG